MVTKLHQMWNRTRKKSSLNLFNSNFPALMGVPLDYFKLDISLLFFKPPH